MIKPLEPHARPLRVRSFTCVTITLVAGVLGFSCDVCAAEHGEQFVRNNRAGQTSWNQFDPDDRREQGWTCGDRNGPGGTFIIVDSVAAQTAGDSQSRVDSIYQAIARLPETGPRVIYLRTGAYKLTDSLVLGSAAEGLTIAACPGETPVLEANDDAPVLILRGTKRVTLIGLVFATSSPTQVLLDNTQDCVIAGSTFLRGGTAILLIKSSVNTIHHNLIVHPTATGIELRDGSEANIVADNTIDGADAPETHGGGIFLHGTRFNRITHNLIQNAAGFGIGVLNWDESTVNVGNVVEYNLIRDTALTAEDSGAIYVLGRSGVDTQIVIAGNVVDGVGSGGEHDVGIYLDDSTNGAVVTRNLVRRVGSYAVQIHGGSDNLIENNVLDLGEGRPAAVLFQAAPADTNPLNAQTGNAVVRNVILSANKDPRLFDWIDGGTPHIANNLYANAMGAIARQVAPVADDQPVTADPGIARDGARDHYAAAQAAATRIGFRPIDLSAVGPRASRGPSRSGPQNPPSPDLPDSTTPQ